MKIFRLYFAVSAILIMMIAAAGGIIEAENNTRMVAFGEEETLRVVKFEELINPRIN